MNNTREKIPFMVSVLLAAGAWLSCLAALFFFWGLDFVWFGVIFIFLAAALGFWSGRARGAFGAFAAQAALAFSLFGKGLLVFGLADLWKLRHGGWFVLVAAVAVLGYPFFRQKADRVICVGAACAAGFVWLAQIWPYAPWAWECALAAGFALAYFLFLQDKPVLRPLAWGLTLNGLAWGALFPTAVRWLGGGSGAEAFSPYPSLLAGAFLCGFYAWRARQNFNALFAVLILLLAYLTNLGAVMGAALLALGFAQKRVSLKITGVLAFALSLYWLYYNMQVTLLVKSYSLCLAGALLLGVYAWLKRGERAR